MNIEIAQLTNCRLYTKKLNDENWVNVIGKLVTR